MKALFIFSNPSISFWFSNILSSENSSDTVLPQKVSPLAYTSLATSTPLSVSTILKSEKPFSISTLIWPNYLICSWRWSLAIVYFFWKLSIKLCCILRNPVWLWWTWFGSRTLRSWQNHGRCCEYVASQPTWAPCGRDPSTKRGGIVHSGCLQTLVTAASQTKHEGFIRKL